MIFGKKEYFTKEHFEKNKGYAPAYLCELVIYCLELLSQLCNYKINFRFKGGNSLLLILDEPQRFSIDVDISSQESKENLISIMEDINAKCPLFTKLEIRQHKTKPWLPMISFKIFFNSFYQMPEESFVMLDAVLKPIQYEGYITKINVSNIYESEMKVEVSTPDGLIGDKLLCIGPSTLGIPLGKNKEAQRLKHIFDISRLLNCEINFDKVKESINNCLIQENEIQNKSFKIDEIIEDTIFFCQQPEKYKSLPDLNLFKPDEYIYEIVKGFDNFKKHLFKIDYTWEMLKLDMLNVAKIIKQMR